MKERKENGMERFDREFHCWGSRPPSTDPEAAGRRIVARLQPARTGLPVWRMAAAAAAVMLLICGTWAGLQFTDGSVPSPLPRPASDRSAEFVPPPLEDNVVLWWLDDETPVYFVLNTGDAG